MANPNSRAEAPPSLPIWIALFAVALIVHLSRFEARELAEGVKLDATFGYHAGWVMVIALRSAALPLAAVGVAMLYAGTRALRWGLFIGALVAFALASIQLFASV